MFSTIEISEPFIEKLFAELQLAFDRGKHLAVEKLAVRVGGVEGGGFFWGR